MNLLNISKYRTELMGVAMLMVVFSHLPIPIHSSLFDFIHRNCVFGVDIFLLLSGMGLYYSSHTGLNLRKYFIKRAIRIYPIYAFVICCVSFINMEFDPIKLFYQITTIGWWTGNGVYDWFIPNLVVMYLLYPIIYYCIKSPNMVFCWEHY